MALMEIEWHPSGRQLRVFGLTGLVASILVAMILHFAWGLAASWSWIVLAAGAGIFLCSLISPTATRIVFIGLTLVAMPIGIVVSFLLLTVFYFVFLVPLAIVFKLIGRDPLRRRYEPTADTYWVPHKPQENLERYLHQF
jgi:hypothetical protein